MLNAGPRLVADRYRLDERVGAGGMGVVWRAHDMRLNRTVAVKQLLLGPGLSPEAADESRARAMREARIAARLQHPNAINVFDVALGPDVEGGEDSQPWLVMEYLPSRSLGEVLAEVGSLPPLRVARIGLQVADALAAAHRKGIVHRDVKPGNVLLGENGTVKITDFGIARATWDPTVTRTGVLTGTPAYFAPEVARGEAPDPASDVFSLGSTLYTAVEGHAPFGNDENTLALLRSVAEGEVRPPQHAGPLTSLLTQLLRYDPAQRPVMPVTRDMLARIVKTTQQTTTTSSLPAAGATAPPLIADSTAVPTAATQSEPLAEAPSEVPTAFPREPEIGQDANTPGPPLGFAPQPAIQHEASTPPAVGPPPVTRVEPESDADDDPYAERPAGDRPGAHRGKVLVGAVLLLLLIIGVGLVLLLNDLGGGDDPSNAAADQSSPAPVTSTLPETAAPTTTEAPATSAAPQAPAAPGPADFEQAVYDYYGLLPTQLDAAYAYLGPDVQEQANGRDGFEDFWGDYSEVEATNVRAEGTTVTLTIIYTRQNGSTFTEPYVLEMGTAEDGRILIMHSEYGGPG
ncbi:MAG: protein kinase [Actinomycetota bacterium]|nr:protein kinase [Actinomycetota bacterium]